MLRVLLWAVLVGVCGVAAVNWGRPGDRPRAAAAEPIAAPTPVPQLRPGGDPVENTRALQRMADAAPTGGAASAVARLDPGLYELADAVRVPADRRLILDGGGAARLYRPGYGPVLTLTPGGRDWTAGRFVLRDFAAISGQVTSDGPVQANFLRVERCEFHSPHGYGIDLSTGYCAHPTIADCRFFGGGLRWRYSRQSAEPHATSGAVFERLYVNTSAEARFGPDVWLEAHHQLTARNLICEGLTAGWATGIDPAPFRRTVGVFVDAPGPRGGQLGPVWCEYWNYTPAGGKPGDLYGGASDVRVNNPYTGSAGPYQSGPFHLADVSCSGPVTVSAVPEALDVAAVEVRGGSVPVADGPVVVRRWLTDALEQRARQTRGPVWDWR